MGRASKLGAATLAIACAIGLFLWWSNRADDAPRLEPLAPLAKTVVPAEASAGTPLAPPNTERIAVNAPTTLVDPPLVVDADLEHPFLYVLVVRTIDQNGLPVSGAQLKLAPPRCNASWMTNSNRASPRSRIATNMPMAAIRSKAAWRCRSRHMTTTR